MLYWLHGYTHGRLQLSPRCWSSSNRQEKMWQDVQPWPIRKADNKAVEAPILYYCQAVDSIRNRSASLVCVLQGAVLGDGSSD